MKVDMTGTQNSYGHLYTCTYRGAIGFETAIITEQNIIGPITSRILGQMFSLLFQKLLNM